MNQATPARTNVIVIKQLFNLIPRGEIHRLAAGTNVAGKASSFGVTRHLAIDMRRALLIAGETEESLGI